MALQQQLATVQLQDTAHRISERNAVEIILKLIDTQRIELLFSKSVEYHHVDVDVIIMVGFH